MALYPVWVAIQGIKEGLSQTATLKQFREGGGHIADATWSHVWASVGTSIAAREAEVAHNLDAIPSGPGEITAMPTVNASGVIQSVGILYRLKGTTETLTRWYSVRSDDYITRADAIETALDAMGDAQASGEYEDQVLLGAFYGGSYELVPGL